MSLSKPEFELIRLLYNNADKNQKAAFVDLITRESPAEKPDILNALDKSMAMFASSRTCPRCGGNQFVKNGNRRGRQRLICKQCKRTVGLTHATPMFATKKPIIVWTLFMRCIESKMSLRRAAAVCNISLPTAWAWKRKYLKTMGDLARIMIQRMKDEGIIEGEVDWQSVDRLIKEKTGIVYKAKYARRKPCRFPVLPGLMPFPQCPEIYE